MDTNALKKFAQAARNLLIDQVTSKLDLVLAEGSPARREHPKAMKDLDNAIARDGKRQVIEQVAYTWFNRFTALRFMDACGYTQVGVVSPAEGQTRPELLSEAMAGNLGAEASFAFVGNTDHNVPFMLKNTDLFEALPAQFHDSAFIDRLHAYLPGWEVDVIRSEMFTVGYGFIVDYLAEILRHLRSEDFSNRADIFFKVGQQISTRDRDAIFKTLSGFVKLLFPNGDETEAEVEDLLRLAMESRKRVKDQLVRIDSTYPDVDFHYVGLDGTKRLVTTVEEEEFPQFYHLKPALDPKEQDDGVIEPGQGADPDDTGSEQGVTASGAPSQPKRTQPEEGHKVYAENRKGISYDLLFGPYIDGAHRIVVTDPYIRFYYQARNMMEFVEMIIRRKAPEDQVSVHLVTGPDEGNIAQQREFLESISTACLGSGVDFTWAFDTSGTAHARDIVTDTGWKIVLDRGLDIFQAPGKSGGFSLGDRLQEQRMAKGFYVTYLRESA